MFSKSNQPTSKILTAGHFRLGFITKFMPMHVNSGFVSAAAVVVAVSQLKNLFGLKKAPQSFVGKVRAHPYVRWKSGFSDPPPLPCVTGLNNIILLQNNKRCPGIFGFRYTSLRQISRTSFMDGHL